MMQHNDSNNKFTHFLKTKGYYMVLALCVLVVGVSAYVFLTDAAREQQALEKSLSTPLTAEEPTALPDLPASRSEESREDMDVSGEPAAEPVQGELEETVMPVSGIVVQDYAMDRLVYNATTQDWRVHNGVDLAAPLGQEVRAARAGTVSAVYEDDCYGMTVVVQHSGGYSSHYAGLEPETAVSAGDTVEAGQVLGTIGETAMIEAAQEPHLHFEVYCAGEPVDPAGFLY